MSRMYYSVRFYKLLSHSNKAIPRQMTKDGTVTHSPNIRTALAKRCLCTESRSSLGICELKSRDVIELKGSDAARLLQGLITNDITRIEHVPGAMLYTLMLNIKGRVMYDLFIYNTSEGDNPNRFFIDCDVGISNDFISVLTRYKIRKKVEIKSRSGDLLVSVIIPQNERDRLTEHVGVDLQLPSVAHPDPRVEQFASRLLLPPANKGILKDFTAMPEMRYTERRYCWGLGEGTIDLPPGNCLPLESNIIPINGASFDKGCYLGQELTARTKFTGVVRKRLVPLLFSTEPGEIEPGVSITSEKGNNAGKYRGHVGQYGLGLVRLSEVTSGKLHVPRVDGSVAVAEAMLPHWWPEDCVEAIKHSQSGGVAS